MEVFITTLLVREVSGIFRQLHSPLDMSGDQLPGEHLFVLCSAAYGVRLVQ